MTENRVLAGDEKAIPVIVYGVFKALGDLLCASAVIAHELRFGSTIHLLLFPSPLLVELLSLIDFGPSRSQLHLHFLPTTAGLNDWTRFFTEMRNIKPDRIWISPHAPREASSWKLPAVLQIIRIACWKGAPLTGADSERGAFALNDRVPLDRSLPLVDREWEGYRMAFSGLPEHVQPVRFIPRLMRLTDSVPEFDLLIHPGANAKNRSWPNEYFAQLVSLLPSSTRIAVLGVPSDIIAMRKVLPSNRSIQYRSGTLTEAITTIASTRLLLTMDSGNVHFAQTLGVRAVALFGKSDPANIISLAGTITAVYEPQFRCQPCGKATCSQPAVYCMNALTPELVSNPLLALLK